MVKVRFIAATHTVLIVTLVKELEDGTGKQIVIGISSAGNSRARHLL
jgi:hypothetical protein